MDQFWPVPLSQPDLCQTSTWQRSTSLVVYWIHHSFTTPKGAIPHPEIQSIRTWSRRFLWTCTQGFGMPDRIFIDTSWRHFDTSMTTVNCVPTNWNWSSSSNLNWTIHIAIPFWNNFAFMSNNTAYHPPLRGSIGNTVIQKYYDPNLPNDQCNLTVLWTRPADLYNLLYRLGSNTKDKFEVAKLLRSKMTSLALLYLMCRYCGQLDEPHRTQATTLVTKAIEFRGGHKPPTNVPMQLYSLSIAHPWDT